MANQYITQAEAAVYSDAIGALTEAKANAMLQVASNQVDMFCGRTFDTVLEPLPPSVAMAVALWAEELLSGTSAGQEKTAERIGDYSVSYESIGAAAKVTYPCPSGVAGLLGAYRNITIG